MSEYIRLSIRGTRNAAEVVLPDDEPLAAMLPDLLELLDEPAGAARPLTLVTVLGEQLNTSLSLAEQDVRQGGIVRLVRLDEAPPPPEVADITQLAGESVAARGDRWRRPWAVLAACVAVAVIGGLLGGTLLAGWPASWLIGAAAGLGVVAALLARRGGHGAAWTVTALAGGLLGAPVASLVAGQPAGAGVGAWLGAAAALLALVALLGFGDRGLGFGAGATAALVTAWAGLGLAGFGTVESAGIIGLAGALGLGLLPGLAMVASGLTALDDRMIEGGSITRPEAADALAATHRGLNAACIGFAAITGAAGYLLGTAGGGDGWALGLAAAVGLILLLRSRVLPLAPQRLALFAAATAVVAGLAVAGLALAPGWTLAGLAGMALGLVAVVGVRLSENLKARLSRLGNLLELLAVVAGVPLLLGLLGVFADLIGAFG